MRARKPSEIPNRIRELVKQGCPPLLASRKALREVAAARARNAARSVTPSPATQRPDDEPADTTGRNGEHAPAKRVTRATLQRMADRLGTTLEVQHGRAIKAGYIVTDSRAASPAPKAASPGRLTAEFKKLKDGDHGGTVAGVAGVFQPRTLDEHGQPQSGLTLEEMLARLRKNPSFRWLESTEDLRDAIVFASRPAKSNVLLDATDLKEYLGIDTATAWWEDSWQEHPAISETPAAAAADTEPSPDPSADQPSGLPPTTKP